MCVCVGGGWGGGMQSEPEVSSLLVAHPPYLLCSSLTQDLPTVQNPPLQSGLALTKNLFRILCKAVIGDLIHHWHLISVVPYSLIAPLPPRISSAVQPVCTTPTSYQ